MSLRFGSCRTCYFSSTGWGLHSPPPTPLLQNSVIVRALAALSLSLAVVHTQGTLRHSFYDLPRALTQDRTHSTSVAPTHSRCHYISNGEYLLRKYSHPMLTLGLGWDTALTRAPIITSRGDIPQWVQNLQTDFTWELCSGLARQE